ncbi:L,D-transpeptidase [Antarcticirhabdus aurantiaca]|uniref:L,D-transpeptidase n=1 Tax=Antarcticirhabdus aurantiaca TaxID=2606717 RepID=A0ACD4NH54_9HYPH|nr:L,D-transpeptidase [Antarcticirhabdus aurantiaca]WAJ26131.1 L,D-transpeptidase [Jeongeuplla avenae]
MTAPLLTRRAFVLGAAALNLLSAGCVATRDAPPQAPAPQLPPPPQPAAIEPQGFDGQRTPELDARYAALVDGGHEIPAVPYWKIDPKFYRQQVTDPTAEAPGTVVVDTANRFLYLVEPGGTAMRYGVGIGRVGFTWEGRGIVHWRQHWPRWKPPAEMIERQPNLERYSVANGGMEPGIGNPLGARALYIHQNGEDTLYRLHGSPEWWTMGTAASAGCVRLVNQDVIDLYERVPHHAPIVVRQTPLSA